MSVYIPSKDFSICLRNIEQFDSIYQMFAMLSLELSISEKLNFMQVLLKSAGVEFSHLQATRYQACKLDHPLPDRSLPR